jgi:phosphoglycerate transporter family protein
MPTATTESPAGLLGIFRPDPPADVMLADPAQIAAQTRYWQNRILVASTIGYAIFYFVRKNISIAMPVMLKQLGLTKADMGLFLTLHGLLYGVSKFINGFLGDRANARTFMAFGLICSAVMNVFFGLSSAAVVLGVFWMLNGWFQGMGFPPCARLLTHWFPPQKLATKMSIWNISHSVGAGAIVILCGYLAERNWRLCFFVPAAIALACAVYLLLALRDTPASLGLPIAGAGAGAADQPTVEPDDAEEFNAFLWRQVFSNKYIWLFSIANFFVYTLRYALLDWSATLLTETRGVKLAHAGWMVAAYEVSGVIGALMAGWLTDRYFGGRGARVAVFYMLGCAAAVLAFWKVPGQSQLTGAALLCAAGFCVYGPQCLVGVAAANLATRRAAATAVGLTGIFGYASTILSGWGLGLLVDRAGWDAAFLCLIAVTIAGAILFAAAWPARPHGYTHRNSQSTTNN